MFGADFRSPVTKKKSPAWIFLSRRRKKKKHRPLFLIIIDDKTELLRVVAIE
jgi:hypothetical protein